MTVVCAALALPASNVSIQPAAVAVSPQLAAAQEQLNERRRQRRQERRAAQLPIHTDEQGCPRKSQHPTAAQPPPRPALAPHLGWESEGYTRAQRTADARRERRAAYEAARRVNWPQPPTEKRPPAETAGRSARAHSQPATDLRLFPDVAIAMLRQGAAAPGRLWLLLQHIDATGRGWVSTAEARSRLSQQGEPLYLCGWRQLRNLLDQGEGLFWQREERADGQRIWLAGTARVALQLGVARIQLEPVALPVGHLLQGIGAVRAHFYACYHSSRYHSGRAVQGRPISRATLAALMQVSPRSQRAYERVAGVRRQPNWAIGPAQAEAEAQAQEMAWERGQALFTFTDRRGHYGRPGARYLAWQLPNSYQGPHQTQGRRHQKALNQQLVDLYSKGFTGNGKQQVEEGDAPAQPSRFYDNGQAAVRALNRGLDHDAYWRSDRREKQVQIWHILPAGEGES